MPGFGLPGRSRGGAPTGRVATWRYLVFALIVALGGLYAAPNLFPPDFAVQVSVDNSDRAVTTELLGELAEGLKVEGIPVVGTELASQGGLIRLSGADDQLRAGTILRERLNRPAMSASSWSPSIWRRPRPSGCGASVRNP